MTFAPRLGYVMSRYPHLSETFITREMTDLAARGFQISLLPLMRQEQGVVHEEARRWAATMEPLGISGTAVRAWGRLARRRPALTARLTAAVLAGYARRPAELARALLVLGAGARLAEIAQARGLERLHVHYATYPALAAWAAHQICGIPYAVTVHAHDIFVTQAMLGPKLRDADLIIPISRYNRHFLLTRVGPELEPKLRVVHCGVRLADHTPVPAPAGPPTPEDPLRLLCIGSLQEYKGQTHLIDAVARLDRAGIPVRLTLIGHGPDEGGLREQISRLGLQSRVDLLGGLPQEEVRDHLSRAQCYVQPSVVAADGQMEGIPVALMEALACALPVVSTRLSGIPELVRDADSEFGPPTGYLVPPGDADALAGAISTIAADPVAARRRAEQGRRLVEDEFDLAVNVQQLGSLLLERRES